MTIKDKILLRIPVLHLELISDLVEKRKYRSKTDFINEAILGKLQKEGLQLTPSDPLGEGWDKIKD